jgi:outer membrane protein OmpA-like peptidoglycan-associated protein
MYEYSDDEGGGRSLIRYVIGAAAVIALIGGAWFVASGRSNGGDTSNSVLPAETTAAAPASGSTAPAQPVPPPASTAAAPPVTEQAATVPPTVAATVAATEPPAPSTTAQQTTTTSAPPATTSAPTTTERPRPRPRPNRQPEEVTYDTLPDGSPAPVVAIYDTDQITITGAVPDKAAKDRLQALALANAKPGQDKVVNFLTINPDVPRGVGARVVELTSTRFPTGSAEIMPAHAAELDRVVSIMDALPHIQALVIGHSDQRGSEETNYELSAARAESVVNYLAAKGVDPSRLSSRAVGEADLLTLNNDEAALALNRRTEFVFYGLLID